MSTLNGQPGHRVYVKRDSELISQIIRIDIVWILNDVSVCDLYP